MKKCLFNTYSDNAVGYCHYHHCGITAKQMKCKGCLNKQCFHLEKNFEHPYWIQRNAAKEKRINRKKEISNYINNLKEV